MAVTDQHPQTHSVQNAHSTNHDAHSTNSAPAISSLYDPEPEPSADWGWHGSLARPGRIAGWFTAFALFAMLIGNHRSHVEDVYLVGIGSLLVVMLIASHLKEYKTRQR